jgi:sarcosine oxidase
MELPGFNHVPSPDDRSYDYWAASIYELLTSGEGVDPDSRDYSAEPVQLEALARYAREWLPGADAREFSFVNFTSTTRRIPTLRLI